MINLKVELGHRSYPIFIGEGILEQFGEMYKIYDFGNEAVVITDTNVQKIYGQMFIDSIKGMLKSFEVIRLPAGEKSKSMATVAKIITRMLESGCDRNVVIIAFGGGVIGDIAGFTASIFKRGVQFVQVPTTLLAQVDASVGGKTGVNHSLGKNMIGTIYQPKMVWSDLWLLKSLPKREILCGLGEIIKYGIIRDAHFFSAVEEHLDKILTLDSTLMSEIVKCCCEIKAEIVAEDERDWQQRMILNFGHTIGHAIEAALGYKKISHGEAVLLGILAESKIAMDLELLSAEEFERIQSIISKVNSISRIKNIEIDHLLQFMKTDKKALYGKVRFVLPKKIGEVIIMDSVEKKLIKKSLNYLLKSQ